MPHTPEEQADIFTRLKLNPNEWEIVDDTLPTGGFVPQDSALKPRNAKTLNKEDESIQPPVGSSTFEAFKTHAINAALPTVAALGTGAAVARAIPSGWGQAIGIPAALAAAYGTSKLQSLVQTPEFQNRLAQTQEEHPYASIAGGLIPSMIAFNPWKSLRDIPTLIRGARNLPRAHLGALTLPQKAVVGNAALNLAIQGGMSGYRQMQNPEGFNVGEFAAETIPGAFLTQPTAIGRNVFGFKPIPRDITQPYIPESARQVKPPPVPSEARLSPAAARYFTEQEPLVGKTSGAELRRIASMVESPEARYSEESPLENTPQKLQELKTLRNAYRSYLNGQKESLSNVTDLMYKYGITNPVDAADYTSQIREIEAKIKEIETVLSGTGVPYQGTKPAKSYEQQTPFEREIILSKDTPKNEFGRYAPERNQEESVTTSRVPEELREYQFALARKRGTEPHLEREVLAGDASIAGRYIPSERRIDISASKSNLDTAAHETLEAMLEDLRTSTQVNDRKLYERTVQVGRNRLQQGKISEYEKGLVERMRTRGNSEEEISLELAMRDAGVTSGLRDIRKLGLGIEPKESGLTEWRKDFTSWAKTKLGSTDDAAVLRLLSARREFEAPFGSRGRYAQEPIVRGGVRISGQEQKRQEEGILEGPDDSDVPKSMKDSHFGYVDDRGFVVGQRARNKSFLHDQNNWSVRQNTWRYYPNVQEVVWHDKPSEETVTAVENYLGKKGLKVEGNRISFGERFSEESPLDTKEQQLSPLDEFQFPVLRSEIDKLKRDYGPHGETLGRAMEDFYFKHSQGKGRFVNQPLLDLRKTLGIGRDVKSFLSQNNESANRVLHYAYEIDDSGNSTVNLTPEEQTAYNQIRSYMNNIRQEQQNRSNQGMTAPPQRGYLIPHLPSRAVLNTILNKPQTPEAARLVNEFLNYQVTTGRAPDVVAARRLLEIFRRGYSKKYVNTAEQFAPLDRAEELRLPPSWRETNLMSLISHFGDRVARRFAFFDTLDRNNMTIGQRVRDAMSEAGNNAVATRIMLNIQGFRPHAEVWRDAVGGLIRAGMLGPLTGAKDFANNLVLGFQHQSLGQAIRSPIEAWKQLRNGLVRESQTEGVNRLNIGSLEIGDDGITDAINFMRRSRDILNSVQGRNFFETLARATAYGQGKWLALNNWNLYRAGNLHAQGKRFMDSFLPEFDSPGFQITQQHIKDAAKRFAESVQGTYDYRGLPEWAVEGSLSPVFSLARWSIEKSNNFAKHVITPAKQGNFRPFLMSTLGMVLGGAAIEQIVEKITGRKSKLPTGKEVQYAFERGKNQWDALAYKMAGLASFAGYAGFLGDLVKSAMDIKFKNRPQTYQNVVIDSVSNVAEISQDLIGALESGEPTAVANAVSAFLENQVQAYRLMLAHTTKKQEETKRQEKFRDIKMFKTLEDLPVSEPSADRASKVEGQQVKEFKQTGDIRKAQKSASELIKKVIKDSKGNPELMKSKFKSLKANSYQTFPSFEEQPLAAINYLQFLRKTQGSNEASSRLMDYIMQREINKVKSKMIP